MLTDTRKVIQALGGIKAVAELTGRNYDAASNWNRPGWRKFPSDTFHVMQGALAALDKTAPPALWGQVATAPLPVARLPRRMPSLAKST